MIYPFKIKQMPDPPVPLLALILVLLSFHAVNCKCVPIVLVYFVLMFRPCSVDIGYIRYV